MGNAIKPRTLQTGLSTPIQCTESTESSVASGLADPISKNQLIELQSRLAELESQNSAQREELRIAAIIFESQEGMLVTDVNSIILRVNRAFTELTGYRPEEVIGLQPKIFFTQLHDESFYQNIRNALKKKGFWQGDVKNRRKDGAVYVERLNISSVKSLDGSISHYVASFTDITSEKEMADKIHHLAYYDPLTNLPNRRLFQNRLERALVLLKRNKSSGALIFIDIDNFKNVNDVLGHDMGDILLTQVATRLVDCLRESDTVARLGGDEFVVILEDLSLDLNQAAIQAQTVGEKIIEHLKQSYSLDDREFHSTSSIGITLFNTRDTSVDELLKQADMAMYASKVAGRDRLHFFNPKMQASIIANANLKSELIEAVAEQQFNLHFQIQVTHDRKVIGAEVLLRWENPKRGMVSPLEFIPLAEQTKLILPIGQWVLETACAQLQAWANNPDTAHLQLAVNISAHQFHEACFVEQISPLLDRFAIQPNRLKLELTESLLLDKVLNTVNKMNELKKMGVSFSMDDFGTGYSSLSYLSQLPFDQLKIDQSFVRNIHDKPADAVIVQTIIGMANNLGISVIAEGVETEHQRAFLERHGCPACQGYLFGKPLPIDQFELLLAENTAQH